MEYVYSEELDKVNGEVDIVRVWRLESCDPYGLFSVMRQGHKYYYKDPHTYLLHTVDLGWSCSLENVDIKAWAKRKTQSLS